MFEVNLLNAEKSKEKDEKPLNRNQCKHQTQAQTTPTVSQAINLLTITELKAWRKRGFKCFLFFVFWGGCFVIIPGE